MEIKFNDETLRKYTICGYKFNELVLFAEACRRQGITEEDLQDFCKDAISAFNYIAGKLVEEFDREIVGGGPNQ